MSTKPTNPSISEEEVTSVAEEEKPLESQVEEEEVLSEIDQLRAGYTALEERFLRQAADFQNFRRRALEDRALSLDIGRNQIALPTIEILDDLRRSIEAAEKAVHEGEVTAFDALHDGVRLVYEKFVSELEKVGIRPMTVVGLPFDEDRHEAMMQQPAPDGTEPGTVIGEIQKGYTIGDRVLRHARVIVAS